VWNVRNVKVTGNEPEQEQCSIYVKGGSPALTWLSDAALGWGKGDRFRLEKRLKMEWKIKELIMKANLYLPRIFSCRHP